MSSGVLAWLRLCRFPAVFTALADICAGYLLSHAWITSPKEFCLLLGSSAGLYLSGMVFNDVFDVEQDRQERPQRPIPSGAISLRMARLFGVTLMMTGIFCAGLVSLNSLLVSLLLSSMILLYDGLLKKTPLGPVTMGSCRFFNILLGASSAGPRFASVWQMPQLWMAAAMGIYVLGITVFARTEARASRRSALLGGLLLVDIGLLMLALWISGATVKWGLAIGPAGVPQPMAVLAVWGVIVLTINRRAGSAVASLLPGRVQQTVGLMLLSIISLDALMIYFKLGNPGLGYAVGTLLLMIPAEILRRQISMT